MVSKKNYVVAKESNPMKYGNTPQSNAQGMNKARHEKQQSMNKIFNGGRLPSNFNMSPDIDPNKLPVPQFQSTDVSNQNSNNASANGNANLVQGKTDATYDICATQPSLPVCTNSAITTQAAGTKSGGKRKKTRRNNFKKSSKKRNKKSSKKRNKKSSKKRTRKH
jgi:hypothetical protein